MRAVVALALAMFGAANTGCSLLFTKGPPPPCTTSNDAPRADTALVVASVALAVVGGSIARNPQTCTASWCGLGGGVTGSGMLIAGGISSVAFTSSAIVGYRRTAGCRMAEENPESAQPARSEARPVQALSSLLERRPSCHDSSDAPRLCSSGVF